MDTDQFDALAARLAPHLTRRRGLGALGMFGVASALAVGEITAGKGKKKKKKKKKNKEVCPAGDYACPAGSKLDCCPTDSECCPTTLEKPAACCSKGCCATANDCGENQGCANGCCYP